MLKLIKKKTNFILNYFNNFKLYIHALYKYNYLNYKIRNLNKINYNIFHKNSWFITFNKNFKLSNILKKTVVRCHIGNGFRTFFYNNIHNGYSLNSFIKYVKDVKFRSKKGKKLVKKKKINLEKKNNNKNNKNFFFLKNINYRNINF